MVLLTMLRGMFHYTCLLSLTLADSHQRHGGYGGGGGGYGGGGYGGGGGGYGGGGGGYGGGGCEYQSAHMDQDVWSCFYSQLACGR